MDLGPPDGRRLIDHGPKVDQPNRGSHSCAATGPDRTAAVPLPSSGASVAGPEKAISRARLHTLRCFPVVKMPLGGYAASTSSSVTR